MPLRTPNFALSVCAILIGSALYRNLEFSPFSVKQPALSLVYFLTLLLVAYALVNDARKKKKKDAADQ
jgi:multisubunit Na+/H+ antiporter MnhG subunit